MTRKFLKIERNNKKKLTGKKGLLGINNHWKMDAGISKTIVRFYYNKWALLEFRGNKELF